MKVEGGGYYLRAVNDGAHTVSELLKSLDGSSLIPDRHKQI